MNLILFLLSFLFASYAPTTNSAAVSDDSNQNGTVVKHSSHHGKTKGGKNGGEYIIGYDYP